MALFADIYDKVRDVVAKDRVLVVEAIIAHDDYSGGLKATGRNVMEISQARLNFAKAIRIRVDGDRHEDSLCTDLKRLLQPLAKRLPGGAGFPQQPGPLRYSAGRALAR